MPERTARPTRAIEQAAQRLARSTRLRPALAIVLGSGFQGAVASLEQIDAVSFRVLPGFPAVTAPGHEGRILFGRLRGVPVCVVSGRAHYYEGQDLEVVTHPVRVLAALGVKALLLTNAAGGIASRFRPGDFMGLVDHINFMGANPLRGPAISGCDRFVDLTRVYDAELVRLLGRAARKAKARWHRGVYLAVAGPSYETPAEIRAFARWGADAVGMSTVPEAMVARQCGLAVAGLSCITNLAAGKGNALLSHADVMASSARVAKQAAALLEEFVVLYAVRSLLPTG